MKKLMFALLGLLLFSSFANACSGVNYDYNEMSSNDGVIFILKDDNVHGDVIYLNENEDRYPVYSYRYGYSYRSSEEYYYEEPVYLNYNHGRSYSNSYYVDENLPNWIFDGEPVNTVYQTSPSYYYEYVDYMGGYQKYSCYNYPPSDKIVYRKCP